MYSSDIKFCTLLDIFILCDHYLLYHDAYLSTLLKQQQQQSLLSAGCPDVCLP